MKRKGILEFIKNCLNNSEFNKAVWENESVMASIETLRLDLYKHYGFSDIEKHSNHQFRFFLLYIDKNHMTFNDISEATFVGYETFKEYVRFYNNTALDYIIREMKINADYYFLLSEYRKSGM